MQLQDGFGHRFRKSSHQPPSLCNEANAYYFFSKPLYSTAVIIPQNNHLVKILSKCCRQPCQNKPLQNARAKRNSRRAGLQILPLLILAIKKVPRFLSILNGCVLLSQRTKFAWGRICKSYHRWLDENKKDTKLIGVILLVAGAGFEPYDLRVMSPMSYQTALPRDKALACASVF